jgi:response regulator RpfG family c-di-GMP phosphodiesterase
LICRNTTLHAEAVALNERLGAQLRQLDVQNRQLDHLNQALQKNLDRSVLLSLKTMESFYPLLGHHARRVYGLCQAMAADLKLSSDQKRVLEVSSRLFDIGLIGIQRELIRKWQRSAESLTEDERVRIQLHPVLGQELVSFVDELEAVGATIRAHHERWDGQGYPDRLSADQIPWLARLLAVGVAYATHSGPEAIALEQIKVDSGAAFDPDAVRALMRSLPHAVLPRSQREVLLAELEPGMIVAHGIFSAYGLLLIPEGQPLTEPNIKLLRNHNEITPITQALLVYC